jgi:transmembrane sensor
MTEQPDNLSFNEDHTERAQRIAYLISAYIRGTISPTEHDELDAWVEESDENMLVFEELTDEKKLEAAIDWMAAEVDTPKSLRRVKNRIGLGKSGAVLRMQRYAAAACLLIIAGITIFMLARNKPARPDDTIATAKQLPPQDLQPGSDKATLTLSDGRIIALNPSQDGTIASQANSEIVNANGQLKYSLTDGKSTNAGPIYNTVTTPRGGSYPLTLSDGSRLWLNAASSVTFPAVFTGNERRVSITGEVYFEVAKNATKPFRVEVKDKNMVVEVLGTHFNINSYTDEPSIKTTLLEGKVKVTSNDKVSFLKPGMQAQVNGGEMKTVSGVDVDGVVAWKEGMFRFRNADLKTIMRQVERWYNIKVVFSANVNTTYSCLLSRKLPVSKLLEILEETGGVHFNISGEEIIVIK